MQLSSLSRIGRYRAIGATSGTARGRHAGEQTRAGEPEKIASGEGWKHLRYCTESPGPEMQLEPMSS
jgi:hypothetical protein